MNTYSKYVPNVFLAKCEEKHDRGEVLPVTTRRGKENDSIIFNLMYEKDGFFYYSIVRADGFNVQERARLKAERYEAWGGSAERKSDQYRDGSNEGADFLSLGEPIKIGHHSEKRHRALIDRNWARMEKSMEFSKKAETHESKADYWESKAGQINLSMPESVEYYEFELEKAKEYHSGLKSGKYERTHSFSLTYAKKEVNDLEKKYNLAIRLWS